MKRLFFSAIFFILLMIIPSFAQDVEIVPETSFLIIKTGMTSFLNVSILNNQNFDDTFTVSIYPSSFYGTSVYVDKTALKIDAGSSSDILLTISSGIESEEITTFIRVTVTSLTTHKSYSKDILLKVVRGVPAYISELILDKYEIDPGDSIKIDVNIKNVENKISGKYSVTVKILKDSETIHILTGSIEEIAPKEVGILTFEYTFDKYAPNGTYVIQAILKDENGNIIDSERSYVKVKAFLIQPSQYLTKKISYGILTATVTISIKNEGNVPLGPFYITESLPLLAKNFFLPKVEPDSQKIVDNRIVYSWLIQSLEPGREIVITYKLFLVYFWFALLLVVFIIYFSFRISFTPLILKRHKHVGPISREKEIKITIEVKNRSYKEIKNIRVIDQIPPIARVLDKFDTLPPKIKKVKDGTRLEWRIRSLKPKEERILTYYIKPLVDIVGELKLPEAKIEIKEGKKRKIIKSPKTIIKSEE